MRYHNSRFYTISILQVILWFTCAIPLHAAELSDDIVVLRTDDMIKGKIVKMEDGVLLIKTTYSEPIKIQWVLIGNIKTAHLVTVLLTSGDTLKGLLSTGPDGNLVLIPTEGAGQVAIQWNDVRALNAPAVKWNGNISIGALSQAGNSESKSASISAEGVRKTAKDRYSARLLFNYAEESETVTARNTFGTMKYDYFHTNYAYSFLALELLNDTFKDINLRTVAGPGVGYQVWDDKNKALSIELGVAYTSEDREESDDDEWIAGRSSVSFRLNAFDIATLSESVLAYINFEDSDDYQVRNEASISSALGSSWSLKISNIIEYDNKPAEKIEKTDVTWIAGLQYAF
jgi:putative salt-induced outer membrane protein YdiY